jgi:N-acetylglucosamine repressor
MNRKNGINMLDVKMGNRSAILELIYRSKGIPRKDIAKALGLTPAAITLITNDLINEGILIEADTRVSAGRGRKEILLEIDSHKYASIGVNITRHHFELICIDFSCKILFQKMYKTSDLHHDAGKILACIAEEIRNNILHADFLAGRQVLGIGASTLGVVDSKKGISVNSYGVFEAEAPTSAAILKKSCIFPSS